MTLLKKILKFVELDELVDFPDQAKVPGVHFSVQVILKAVHLVFLSSFEQSLAPKDIRDAEMCSIDYGELDEILLTDVDVFQD